MKKITIAIFMLLGFFSMASAEVGVNLGVSGSMGAFTAKGNETMGTSESGQEKRVVSVFGYGSIFIEKTLGDYLTVGVDYVPSALDSETSETNKKDGTTAAPTASKSQVIKVSFEDLITYYAAINITENLYVKAGLVEADVITKESLGTGGSYGNTSLDGTMMGVGYDKELTNGMFVRAEGTYTDFDNIKLNSASGETRFVEAKDIAGVAGKISIGKSF